MRQTPLTLEGAALAAIQRINKQLPAGMKLLTIYSDDVEAIIIDRKFDMLEEERIDVVDDDIDLFGGKNLIEPNLRAKLASGTDQANVASIRIFSRKLLLALVAEGAVNAEEIKFDRTKNILELGELSLNYDFIGKEGRITGIYDLSFQGGPDMFQFCTLEGQLIDN